eukprot:gene20382-7390_t
MSTASPSMGLSMGTLADTIEQMNRELFERMKEASTEMGGSLGDIIEEFNNGVMEEQTIIDQCLV